MSYRVGNVADIGEIGSAAVNKSPYSVLTILFFELTYSYIDYERSCLFINKIINHLGSVLIYLHSIFLGDPGG